MIEIVKLIEYAELAGFPLFVQDGQLIAKNGKNLPFHLKEQITIHKDDVIFLLEEL